MPKSNIPHINWKPTPIIEACYYRSYADPIINFSKTSWVGEMPMFIVAVNYTELLSVPQGILPKVKAGVLSSRTITEDLALTPFLREENAPTVAIQMINWINTHLVRPGATWEINLGSDFRIALLNETDPYKRMRWCQAARNNIAKDLHTHATGTGGRSWKNHIDYAKKGAKLNAKMLGTSHDDVASLVQGSIDKQFGSKGNIGLVVDTMG